MGRDRQIDLTKPLMVIDYLLEHDSEELYKSDHAKKLGIEIDDDDTYGSFEYLDKHEISQATKDSFAFCWATGTHISIEEMEKFIEVAKKKGATHLDIHHHTDHGNYNLHALRFRLATDKEMEKLKKQAQKANDDKLKEIDKTIESLAKQRAKLTNGHQKD